MALYAGIGAVMILALVISFSNLTTSPEPTQYAAYPPEAELYDEEAVLAGYDLTPSYQQAHTDLEQALFRPRATPTPSPEPPATPPAAPATAPPPREEPQEPPSEPAAATPTPQPATPAPAPANEPAAANVADFAAFTEDERMSWPVYGDIAMIFSQDSLIWNPTLDQWRTNDDLRISAQEGTPVRAAAAGRVAEIGYDRIYGNFIRIDNGNGWETIFGQLMEGVLVTEGDVVQTGQVLGGVGRPSVSSVLNGHHVSLRVLRDSELVDPKLVLTELS